MLYTHLIHKYSIICYYYYYNIKEIHIKLENCNRNFTIKIGNINHFYYERLIYFTAMNYFTLKFFQKIFRYLFVLSILNKFNRLLSIKKC